MNINELVESNPNDMELGAKVRELYWKEKTQREEFIKTNENLMIYESPDGGSTVYQRPFGSNVSERKLVTKQLTIFDDEAYKES